LTEQFRESEEQQKALESEIRDISAKLEKKETLLSAKEEEISTLKQQTEDEGYVHEALMQRKEETIRGLQRSLNQGNVDAEKEVEKANEKVKDHEEKVEALQQSLDDKLIMVSQLQQGITVLEEELKETKAYYENLVAPEEVRKMGMKLREMLNETHLVNSLSIEATPVAGTEKTEEIIDGTHSSRGVSDLRNLLLATSVINGGEK